VGLHDTNYVESHNELLGPNSRLIEKIDGNSTGAPPSLTAVKKTTLAATILFTTPGVPLVYQGDEFFDYSTFDYKTPLNWSNETTYSGIQTLYQKLIAARVNYFTNTPGLSDPNVNFFHDDTTNDVVAWDRYNSSAPCTDDVVIVANLNSSDINNNPANYQVGLPCSGTWRVTFNGDSTAYDSGFGNVGLTEGSTFSAQSKPYDGYSYSAALNIGKFSAIILTKN
jgi:1,4-alpha-glucan branching enzyme